MCFGSVVFRSVFFFFLSFFLRGVKREMSLREPQTSCATRRISAGGMEDGCGLRGFVGHPLPRREP